jgi:two-component system sensor histidine kinase YesM
MQMKFKHIKYLSTRILWVTGALFAFIFALLIFISILAVQGYIGIVYVLTGYASMGLLLFVYYKWIYEPYRENAKVLQLFAAGYTIDALFDRHITLSPEMDKVIEKVQEIMETYEILNATKKQAHYLALQNQINPHFLYNTLEGIRGETLSAGLDNVAKMTEALATFFRYTISNVENLVTLEDELKNVNNYYIIQQYRFGERLSLSVEYDAQDEIEIMSCRVPKLILQPIVENAIYHGIERKIGEGKVRIKIESTAKRLIITVSDNGVGMTEDKLQEINDRLKGMPLDYIKPENEKHGGIAITNVNSRIKLLFGEEYGICIYSTLNAGTDVEITLPKITERNQVLYEK